MELLDIADKQLLEPAEQIRLLRLANETD